MPLVPVAGYFRFLMPRANPYPPAASYGTRRTKLTLDVDTGQSGRPVLSRAACRNSANFVPSACGARVARAHVPLAGSQAMPEGLACSGR
eukprot:scaffold517_cov392-Prasinococcus_capsulatus_cf.AAC.3